MDARLGLEKQDEGHDEGINVLVIEEFNGIVWLADEDIQFGEVPSPSLVSLYPPSISIHPSTTADIMFHPHQKTPIHQATSYPPIKSLSC